MKLIAVLPISALLTLLTACTSHQPRPDSKAHEVCHPITNPEIDALFVRWNDSLKTGNPDRVVANYAERSILLPTLSNIPRLTPAEKREYFVHFLEKHPSGSIDMSWKSIGCNTAIDAGLYTFTLPPPTDQVVPARYTFTYAWNGREWLITSHHSSGMPEWK